MTGILLRLVSIIRTGILFADSGGRGTGMVSARLVVSILLVERSLGAEQPTMVVVKMEMISRTFISKYWIL